MSYDRVTLLAQLKTDEGVRLRPYMDAFGKVTIGVGRNLTDNGISGTESDLMLDHDVDEAEAELTRNLPWWSTLSDARQRALLNLCFNLGWTTLSTFKNFLGYLFAGDFAAAADDLLQTAYAREVGQRAQRVASLLRNG